MEQNLSINLVPDGGQVDNPYWLHMEIKKDALQDGMTVAAAARIIDAVYNIKACEPAETQQQDVWQQSDSDSDRDIWTDTQATIDTAAANLEAQRRFAASLSEYTTDCDGSQSLSELVAYDVIIKVFRSHREELYKLQMVNGTAGTARKCTGRVVHTVDIEGGSSYTFNNPIIAAPVLSWQGLDGPEIHILGNTAYWDDAVTGTLRAEFDTEWDEVGIHVTGEPADSSLIVGTSSPVFGTGFYSGSESGEEIDDYQDVECSVLAFYHYEYEELVLNRPEEDESTTDTDRLNICHFVMSVGDDDSDAGEADPDAICQQHVNETIVCQCDGKEESDNHYEPVPCPPGVSAGSTLQGSQERRTYKDCGYRDSANDPVFYEEKCCESPDDADVTLPLCKTTVTKFTGTSEKAFNEADYPKGTNFVTVSPVDGQCGEHVTEQVIHAAQCCDGIPPLVWDDVNSVEVIALDSSGTVYVSAGKSPYTWSVRGSGFSFSGGLREAVTAEPWILVYTDDDACGSATVVVTDGCTSATGSIRGTVGTWQQVGMIANAPQDYPEVLAQGPYSCSCNLFSHGRLAHDVIKGSRALTYGNHNPPDPSVDRWPLYKQNWWGCFDDAPATTAGHPADESFTVTVFNPTGADCGSYGISSPTLIWEFKC